MRSLTAASPRRPGPTRSLRWLRLLLVAELVAVGLMVTAAAASAETTHVVALAKSVDDVLNNIRNWIMGILALLATVFGTFGGVRYLVANGDPGEIEKAKQAFKSCLIGYGLAALAPVLVEVLKGIVGA